MDPFTISGRALRGVTVGILLAFMAALVGCASPVPEPFEQDVYVWQRNWTPAVALAVRQAAAHVSSLRVLAAEVGPNARIAVPRIDFGVLLASARPVVAVVRLDGRLEQMAAPVSRLVPRILAEWHGAGLTPSTVEIDFDCPRSRLADYELVLRQVRRSLPPAIRLSITSLPDWLKSSALEGVLASSDASVLQVHAVDGQATRLVDPARTRIWIRQYSRRTSHPFQVALPAYGSTLLKDSDGDVIAVESESPQWLSGLRRVDLAADPVEISELVHRIRSDAVAHFAGIAWFRLPTADDQRAWSFGTWLAVVEGRTLSRHIDVVARTDRGSGSVDIVLVNYGAVDAPAPREITLMPACTDADAVNGYELTGASGLGIFRRSSAVILPAGRFLIVGWMRCDASTTRIQIHD